MIECDCPELPHTCGVVGRPAVTAPEPSADVQPGHDGKVERIAAAIYEYDSDGAVLWEPLDREREPMYMGRARAVLAARPSADTETLRARIEALADDIDENWAALIPDYEVVAALRAALDGER